MSNLSAAQKAALKTDIAGNTATIPAGQPWTNTFAGTQVKNVPNTGDGNATLAGWYNQAAVSAWTVWKTLVSLKDISLALNGTELAGLTTANHTRLQTIISLISAAGGANPSDADIRAFFDDIFSGAGGTTTRANLLALWKRFASYVEKLLSTGTGSDAAPAILGYEGDVTGDDIEDARNS
jgi:hypothetical protein